MVAIPRGIFIVLEGLDRCGKSTQCKLLLEFLQRRCAARIQRYPDRSEPTTGPKIDHFLRTAKSPYQNAEEIHCLFSQNRKVLDSQIQQELLNGTTIIADRYSFSGIAYTVAKGVPMEFACSTELGLLKPDIVIFLDADPETTAKRAGFGDEALEKLDYQKNVYKQMKTLINPEFWKDIDALRSIEDVHDSIKDIITEAMHAPRDPLESFTLPDFNM